MASASSTFAEPDIATEKATFGMGCFWAPEPIFGSKKGVVRTKVGYTGGKKENPTYYSMYVQHSDEKLLRRVPPCPNNFPSRFTGETTRKLSRSNTTLLKQTIRPFWTFSGRHTTLLPAIRHSTSLPSGITMTNRKSWRGKPRLRVKMNTGARLSRISRNSNAFSTLKSMYQHKG